jgi:putative peptidoglycan lipid II flippase
MKFSQIFKSIFFVGSLTVLTKILGMIKEMIVASRFGISVELDEFYIALILPNFFINVFSNAVLPAFLPLVSKNCQKPKEQLGSFLTRTTFWVGGLYFGLWLVIFLGYLIWQKSQFFSNSFIGLMRVDYFLLMSPSIIFVAISQLWCAFLNSRKHFLFTSLRTSIVPLFTIVLLIFFPRLGFKSLVVGFLGGSFLELPFLWFSLNKNGFSFHRVRFIWDGFDSSLFKQLFYLIASASILNGTTIVDQTMAGWSGPCNLTALNYGLKLPAFCLGVFGLAAGTVLLPEFSDVYVKNDF